MDYLRDSLNMIEWDMNVENDVHEVMGIIDIDHGNDKVDLFAEPITAYGDGEFHYWGTGNSILDLYSFEFNRLVSSYPTADNKINEGSNRERIEVGLVHSVLLVKWLAVKRLEAIRCYHDRNRLADGRILETAFKLLLVLTKTQIPDDSMVWRMFDSLLHEIPIFPYRMQMVTLWDQATNWRVLQASARQDIRLSNHRIFKFELYEKNNHRVLSEVSHLLDIFDFCAKWTFELIEEKFDSGFEKVSMGVVLETVRSFLAEWVIDGAREPNWKSEVPTAPVFVEIDTMNYLIVGQWDLIWI